MTNFKQRLHAGDRLNLFAVGRMFHPNIVHYLGMSGEFDGFWIDGEHGGFTTSEIESAVTAGLVYGLESFVRIAPTDYAVVTRCYESGAAGIMAAQVTSPAQTEEIVSWAKFYPGGRRGLNPLGHDGRFGTLSLPEFTTAANDDHFVCIQIETLGAVEEVDAIAAVEGVDMLFVGPSDLSQALGVVGDFTHPRCIEALDAVAEACRAHGKRWAAVTPTPEYAEMLIEKGCTVVSAVNDVKLVTAGLQTMRDKFDSVW